MQRRFAAPTLAMTLLAAAAAANAAENPVKPGRWEFSTTMPGVTRLPSGMTPLPGMRVGPNGLTTSRTQCITAADPIPPYARKSTPDDPDHPCRIDKIQVSGATVRWSYTCTTPEAKLHEDGIVQYHGDTLDGALVLRGTIPGRPQVENEQPITGRYLGPCDGR